MLGPMLVDRPRPAWARIGLAGPGLEQLWQLAALAAAFIAAAGAASLTADSWWALALGRLTIETGRPQTDTALGFAPTIPGAVHSQWLAHVVLYGWYGLGGETGLRVGVGLTAVVTFWLVVVTGRRAGGTGRTAALGALLALLCAANNLSARAQLFSYLLLVLLALLLVERRRHPRLVAAILPLFALWANLHGAFVLGLALLGLHALADAAAGRLGGRGAQARVGSWASTSPTRLPERWLRSTLGWAALLLASVGATAVSPLGLGVYGYVWSVVSSPSTARLVSEWASPTLDSYSGRALAAATAVTLLVLWRSGRRLTSVEAATLLLFGALALTGQRYVVWWGLLAGPVVARHAAALRVPGLPLAPAAPARASEWRLLNAILAGLLVLAAAGAPVWRPALAARIEADAPADWAPVGAVEALAALPDARAEAHAARAGGGVEAHAALPDADARSAGRPGRRLFVYQPWSGYAAWRLWPQLQPMTDVRIEAHPTTVWAEYLAVSAGQDGWEAILARYDVDVLLLERRQQAALAAEAARSARWSLHYQDGDALVFARHEP